MPNKNDLVLLFDDKEHRQKWILGKTTELISSNDEQVWGAKVFLGKTWNIIDQQIEFIQWKRVFS